MPVYFDLTEVLHRVTSFKIAAAFNSPLPNYPWRLFQNEAWCSTILVKKEFNLDVNESSKSYERMSTRTRFQDEAKGNSEVGYYYGLIFISILKTRVTRFFEEKI